MIYYRVAATYRKDIIEYTVLAKSGKDAVKKARELARGNGMNRILVREVHPDYVEQDMPGGAGLTVDQVNAEIEYVLGQVQLKAYDRDGVIVLDDGENNPAEFEYPPSATLVAVTLYEWAIFVGWTNEDMEDFFWQALNPRDIPKHQ